MRKRRPREHNFKRHAHRSHVSNLCIVDDIYNYYASVQPGLIDYGGVNCIQSQAPGAGLDPDDAPPTTIHNLVCTCYVESDVAHLDLIRINESLPNATHNHKAKFAAVTIRLAAPLCTVLLFSSGKLVVTGCNQYLDCVWGSLQITQLLRLHYPMSNIKLSSITIQNIVANTDLHLNVNCSRSASIDLERLHADHNVNCTYAKHMFPGLIYRQQNLPVVLLVFLSGKCVITGARRVEDVETGWRLVWPLLRQYIVKNPS